MWPLQCESPWHIPPWAETRARTSFTEVSSLCHDDLSAAASSPQVPDTPQSSANLPTRCIPGRKKPVLGSRSHLFLQHSRAYPNRWGRKGLESQPSTTLKTKEPAAILLGRQATRSQVRQGSAHSSRIITLSAPGA